MCDLSWTMFCGCMRTCILRLLDGMFRICLLGLFGLKYSSSPAFLCWFCLDDPSIVESRVVKSLIIIVLPSISLFTSVNNCFINLLYIYPVCHNFKWVISLNSIWRTLSQLNLGYGQHWLPLTTIVVCCLRSCSKEMANFSLKLVPRPAEFFPPKFTMNSWPKARFSTVGTHLSGSVKEIPGHPCNLRVPLTVTFHSSPTLREQMSVFVCSLSRRRTPALYQALGRMVRPKFKLDEVPASKLLIIYSRKSTEVPSQNAKCKQAQGHVTVPGNQVTLGGSEVGVTPRQ